jgi:enoyl-CoA hydratase/carnithine racemase
MIKVTKNQFRWTVTLNRPDKANAINIAMLDQLNSIMDAAKKENSLRSLIFTGAGKVFSAGADLTVIKNNSEIATTSQWKDLSGKIVNIPCLTLAALNGTLAGGAFGMALACDLRISTPEANFFYPVLKHNLLPQPNDIERMVEIAGLSTAKLIFLGGQKLSAKKALETNLIDHIFKKETFNTQIDKLCQIADNNDGVSLLAIKRLFQAKDDSNIKEDAKSAVFEKNPMAIKRLKEFMSS